jgi:hypothetical protein
MVRDWERFGFLEVTNGTGFGGNKERYPPDLEGNKDDEEGTSSQQRTANSLRRAFHLKRERVTKLACVLACFQAASDLAKLSTA